METLFVALLLGVLLGLLFAVSRRWGPPRLYLPVTLALWAVVAIFGVVVVRLWLD